MRLLLIFAVGVLIGALCVTLGFYLGQSTTAVEPSRPAPVVLAPWPSVPPVPTVSPLVPEAAPPRSQHRIPSEPPGADQAGSPTPDPSREPIVRRVVSGRATWYSVGPGLYAAAGPGIRVGAWRGRTVRVCVVERCVDLRLVDWCACGPRHGSPTVIDLSRDAFAALADPSLGILPVEVRW